MRTNLKNIDRRLLTILLIVFVGMVGASMILPILPLYAQSEFGLPPQAITLLSASFFAAQFLAGPPLGRLSDKHGRVPILIISQIGTALSFVMLALAGSAFMLFAARILDGITGGNIIVAQAYITDITPQERRTEALGMIFAMFGISFFVGPALGGVLSAAFGPRVPYVIAALAATFTVILTWFTLNESVSAEQRQANRRRSQVKSSPGEIWHNTPLLIVLLAAFIGQFGLGLLASTFALFGKAVLFADSSQAGVSFGVGMLLTVVGLGQLVTQLVLLRPLLARFGDARLVVVGALIRALSFVILALVMSPWLGAIGSALFAVGMGLIMPPLQSLATKSVDDSLRGGVLGLYQSVSGLGTIISTAIAGILFAITPQTPYWLGAILSLVVVLPAIVLVQKFQPSPIPLPDQVAEPNPKSGQGPH